MAKPEWGTKRLCPNCGTRYYDMRKDPPTCPSCATVFDPEALLRSRRTRPIPPDEPKRAAAVVEEGDEAEAVEPDLVEEEAETLDDADEVLEADDIEDEDDADAAAEDEVLIEDTSELADEEDMGEVVDLETGEEER